MFGEGLSAPSECFEILEDLGLEFEVEDLLRPLEIVGSVPLGTIIESARRAVAAGSVVPAPVGALLTACPIRPAATTGCAVSVAAGAAIAAGFAAGFAAGLATTTLIAVAARFTTARPVV
ncbi:MAG: hypothetical protein H6524_05890 [Actinobacteria bacterium]|nr:hypothetical protein [Micrococcales bacterium]MCB0904818.1 hypothetical protein [Actinomycetota bacterium]MCO5299614.1 hypothetical protein [Candidatus Nanopelagicales bacterium]MCB9428323.1 hypothetical protein [Actinomycetota bacterium]HPJ19803.1 hypothetical protein [Actinomycetota bacterium]